MGDWICQQNSEGCEPYDMERSCGKWDKYALKAKELHKGQEQRGLKLKHFTLLLALGAYVRHVLSVRYPWKL